MHDPSLSFAEVWHQIEKESSALLRGTTTSRNTRSSAAKNTDAHSSKTDPDKTGAKTVTSAEDAENEAMISQILAQQSGNLLQWPKVLFLLLFLVKHSVKSECFQERMLIFRLQNVCLTVEQGEWPSASRAALNSADLDQRSTPDDTPRDTPSIFEDSRDSPFAATPVASQPVSAARRGRKAKLRPTAAASSLATTSSSAAVTSPAANPLQDLMEAEKERMRALMHQSFLHQLEQIPFAAMAASG